MTGQMLRVRSVKRHGGRGETAVFHVTVAAPGANGVIDLYLTRSEMAATGIDLPVHLVESHPSLEVVK